MRNLKFTVRYDGTDFSGWQTQPGFRTVQETIEKAFGEITLEPRVRINCSGRTDAGVHSVGQVFNAFTSTQIGPAKLVKALNSKLPEDIAITSCEEVSQSFDANSDAVRKLYRYVINDTLIPDPFLRKYAWQTRRILDAERMHRSGQVLLGRHDFRCFETNYPNRLTSIRTITHFDVSRFGECLWIDVEADGFCTTWCERSRVRYIRSVAATGPKSTCKRLSTAWIAVSPAPPPHPAGCSSSA